MFSYARNKARREALENTEEKLQMAESYMKWFFLALGTAMIIFRKCFARQSSKWGLNVFKLKTDINRYQKINEVPLVIFGFMFIAIGLLFLFNIIKFGD
jgi:hypothetical protein